MAKLKLKITGDVGYGLAGSSENHIAINNVAIGFKGKIGGDKQEKTLVKMSM